MTRRPEQIPLGLALPAAMGRADFFVTPANARAVAMVERWADWPQGKLVLSGPQGAGKTHLARVWAEATGARVCAASDLAVADLPALVRAGHVAVEDIAAIVGDPQGERALFHLHNMLAAADARLLMTARAAPARLALRLPDLASRLQASATVALEPPDDALLQAVLVKLFADRQLEVSPPLIAYLLARMERSLAAAQDLVARLDARALAGHRRVSRTLAAEVLAETPFSDGAQ